MRYGENGPEYLEKRLSGDSGRVLLELTAKFKRKGMSTNIKESSRKLGRRFTGVEERRECLFEFSAVKSAKEEDNRFGAIGFSHCSLDALIDLEPRGES